MLDVSRNLIKRISSKFIQAIPNLTSLLLDFNKIESLPKNITSLSKLKILSVIGNRLVSLPNDLSKLDKLVEIRHEWQAIVDPFAMTRIQGMSTNHSRRYGL